VWESIAEHLPDAGAKLLVGILGLLSGAGISGYLLVYLLRKKIPLMERRRDEEREADRKDARRTRRAFFRCLKQMGEMMREQREENDRSTESMRIQVTKVLDDQHCEHRADTLRAFDIHNEASRAVASELKQINKTLSHVMTQTNNISNKGCGGSRDAG